MKNYIICYDLRSRGHDYDALVDYLETYPTRWHVLNSMWIVGPADSALAVAQGVRAHLGKDDKLFVQPLTHESAWCGFDENGSNFFRSARAVLAES